MEFLQPWIVYSHPEKIDKQTLAIDKKKQEEIASFKPVKTRKQKESVQKKSNSCFVKNTQHSHCLFRRKN